LHHIVGCAFQLQIVPVNFDISIVFDPSELPWARPLSTGADRQQNKNYGRTFSEIFVHFVF
jgi:hypothetical protein